MSLLLSNSEARLVEQRSLQQRVADHRPPWGCPGFGAGLLFCQQFSGEDERCSILQGQSYKFPIWDVAKKVSCFLLHTFFFSVAPKLNEFCVFSLPLPVVAGLEDLLQINILKSWKVLVVFMSLSCSWRLLLSLRVMG